MNLKRQFFLNSFLLNNIYLHRSTIHYITNTLLQNYLAYIEEKVITISHRNYQSFLVHTWRSSFKTFTVNLF